MKSGSLPEETGKRIHKFTSAAGSPYIWEEDRESIIPLEEDEITRLRETIINMADEHIRNEVSGNGIPMGVKIPLSQDRLKEFLKIILTIVKFKEKLSVKITDHAAKRLEEDMLSGYGDPESRGWLSEDDVHHCVFTINQVDGARLTINRSTLKQPEVKFNTPIALEVMGKRPDGTQGTLALAFFERHKVRIITLL